MRSLRHSRVPFRRIYFSALVSTQIYTVHHLIAPTTNQELVGKPPAEENSPASHFAPFFLPVRLIYCGAWRRGWGKIGFPRIGECPGSVWRSTGTRKICLFYLTIPPLPAHRSLGLFHSLRMETNWRWASVWRAKNKILIWAFQHLKLILFEALVSDHRTG